MRALSFLAALLLAAPAANAASTELELLQDRCSTLESRIEELERENGLLKTQLRIAPATAVVAEAPKQPAPAVTQAPAFATVREGDTLSKVAKRHGTTTATLIQLNKLADPSLIRPGQKLRLPAKPAPAPSAAAPAPTLPSQPSKPIVASTGGTHIVKAEETFYSIARHYGLGVEALQAANPHIQPEKLRAGQTLNLGGSIPTSAVVSTPRSRETASIEPIPTAETLVQPVRNTPRVRLVAIDEPILFGAFAAAHGTSIEKLNALNGHNLNPGTVLAKGSEFYVPVQP